MIRRKSDGLFSTGGMSPRFSTKGKVWTNMSGLKNHLVFAYDRYGSNGSIKINPNFTGYLDCEIISYELVPEIRPTPFDLPEFLIGKLESEAQKELDYQTKYKAPKYWAEIKITYPDGSKRVLNPLNDNPVSDN